MADLGKSWPHLPEGMPGQWEALHSRPLKTIVDTTEGYFTYVRLQHFTAAVHVFLNMLFNPVVYWLKKY